MAPEQLAESPMILGEQAALGIDTTALVVEDIEVCRSSAPLADRTSDSHRVLVQRLHRGDASVEFRLSRRRTM
jgi:hypothetical protein